MGTRRYGPFILYSSLSVLILYDPALKFDPDRFLDARLHKYLTPNPFIFCPFNAGPRICLGQQVSTSPFGKYLLSEVVPTIVCIS